MNSPVVPAASQSLKDIPLKQLIACEECDTVYQRKVLATGERAYCVCCGAALYKNSQPLKTLLPLVLTAFIVFVIANSFPIVKIEMQGNLSDTTLLGAVWAMLHVEQGVVGLLLFFTTFLVPLLDMLLLLYLLLPITLRQQKPRFLVKALRIISWIRIWGMIEVFLVGVLVTLVKLAGMVIVIPGIALWAFAALSVLQIWIFSFKVIDIWHDIEERNLS